MKKLRNAIALVLSLVICLPVLTASFTVSADKLYNSQEEASELLSEIIIEVLKEYDGETVDELVDKVYDRLLEETNGEWYLTAEGRLALYYRIESYLKEYKHEIEESKKEETKPAETAPVTPTTPAPSVKEESYWSVELEYTDTFTLSNCDFNNLTFTLKDNYLKVSGVFTIEGLNGIMFSILDLDGKILHNIGDISITSGTSFTRTYDLSGLKDLPNEVFLSYYTGTDKSTDGMYWATPYHTIVLKRVNGVYRIVNSPRIEKNTNDLSNYINPGLCINVTPNASVEGWANQICEGLTDDYSKAYAIYTWICTKIYYDSGNKNQTASNGFYNILNSRESTNRGFADILEAMLESQGIPAIITTVYAQNVKHNITSPVTNYVQYAVEAYIDGRWVIMVPYLDHSMEIVNGERICAKPKAFSYFDITMQTYSANFSLAGRRTEKAQNIPSDWALDEVLLASAADIVPVKVHQNYRESITRAEFCSLIMQMLRVKHGVNDVKALLAIYSTDYKENFYDTDSEDVNGAYLLGIVNGRGVGTFDPYNTLTRQEAAVMLSNTAKFLGLAPSTSMNISDLSSADSWAQDAIKTVTGLVSTTGKTVMNGVDLTRFAPKDRYTREQSILTVYRLFMCE